MSRNAIGVAPHILVTEDDDTIRDVLALLLEDEGFSVLQAADGYEGLRLAQAHNFDLILMDLAMPKFDGEDFCRRYREQGGITPVILLTAANQEDVAAAVETCSAIGYIAKPF